MLQGNVIEIPLQEICFHATSFCDRDGRVFWWQGNLYRGITGHQASFYRNLFEEGVVQSLVNKGFLVETELTNLTLQDYAMVLHHRRVPFVSYANEWCPEMLKDAALFITDMMLELANHNLTLVGFSTWDLLFNDVRPVYVDFCTIDRADFDGDRGWTLFKDDFHTYLIYPLRLMSQGYGNLARWLLADYEHNVIHPEFATLMGYPSLYAELNRQFPSWRSLTWRNVPAVVSPIIRRSTRFLRTALMKCGFDTEQRGCEVVKYLRREVEGIYLPIASPKQESDLSVTPSAAWTPKQYAVYQVLSDLCPPTVLDIGCHQGWYSQLAASLGSRVVAIDKDDRQVAHCYQAAKNRALSILPLVIDIRYPSPGQGICNQVITPALRRLPCDLVLALGLVHLLVFDQHLVFEQVCETFAAFSKQWLLVEFISCEDPAIYQHGSGWPPWYRLDTFIEGLKQYFRQVSPLPAHSEFHTLLLCNK
jgi:hypothetical protein